MSWIHWVVVLIVVILIFGTKRLRNLGQDLGESVKGFKKGMADDDQAGQRPPAQLSDGTRDDATTQRESDRNSDRDGSR